MDGKPEIVKICAYCVKAEPLSGGETMLCSKHGVVTCDNHCRRFKYDPLKRVPMAPIRLEHIDLSLEGDETAE